MVGRSRMEDGPFRRECMGRDTIKVTRATWPLIKPILHLPLLTSVTGEIVYFCSLDDFKNQVEITSVLGEFLAQIKGDYHHLARCLGNSLLL